MDDINERILLICKEFNLHKASDLARALSITHQSASNYLKGNKKPNFGVLKKIKLKFENINADWLLTGEGNMLKTIEKEHKKDIGIQDLRYLIQLQREKIQNLEKEVLKLKKDAKTSYTNS